MASPPSPRLLHVAGSFIGTHGQSLCRRAICRSYAFPAMVDEAWRRAEGPSCLFIGPLETATQENLEALYRQAREAYYGGQPLIVDDMFDRVELKLRWYGSKYVVKYPRCSLRGHSTYADAEEDPSQVLALASIWLLILGFGASACTMPIVYAVGQAYHNALYSGFSHPSFVHLNAMLFMLLGTIVGYPIASASVRALKGLWQKDMIALKGVCPNCCEEVYAFVGSDQLKRSLHRVECHVCESSLEFRTRTKFEQQTISTPDRRRWVYGRIYLIRSKGRW